VSENESFIEEVTEEVRRDKLYLFFKRYGWIPIVSILAIILGSIFVEIRSSRLQAESEQIGDFLSVVLNDGALEIPSVIDPKSVVAIMLEAKILENKFEYEKAAVIYEKLLNTEGVKVSLQDFVRFKLLLFANSDPDKVKKLFVDLINPDSSFNLLALEQKVLVNISENNLQEALSDINLLIADPKASQGMVSRANQIKKAIEADSL
jgi:hypothetical protein